MNNYKKEIAKLQTQLDELKSKIEKPKLEAGKWYKSNDSDGLFFITQIKESSNPHISYGFSRSGHWVNEGYRCLKEDYIEATPKEVEEALTKEAVKRVLVNSKYIPVNLINKQVVKVGDRFHYDSKENKLLISGWACFKDGTWATPIKTKTIREIFENSTVDFYKSAEQYSLYDDLISFLTENKQTIIETLNNL